MAQNNSLYFWILFWLLLPLTTAVSLPTEQSSDVDEAEATLARLRRAACSAGDCQNGGFCWPGPVTASTPPCVCPEPYLPPYCVVANSNPVDYCAPGPDNPCKNGATCNRIAVSPFYSCSCVPGFTGFSCEINIDDCASRPCINGQCTDLVNSYNCSCYSGWEGSNCGTNHDDCFAGACLNRGRCVDGNKTYTCDCSGLGFSGSRCEVNIDDCVGNPCINGLCSDGVKDYSCSCYTGWEGFNCSVDTNYCLPMPCQNGGLCSDGNSTYNCDCSRIDFQGVNCSSKIDDCLGNNCQNGGRCVDGVRRYTCDCTDTGFKGAFCEINTDDCASHPCINGLCTDLVKDYNCSCYRGWEGKNCSVDTNYCVPSPCQNGGLCSSDGNSTYTCSCDAGFGGKNCSVRLTGCDSTLCRNGATCEPVLLRELPTPEHGHLCTCTAGWTGPQCNLTTLVSFNGSTSFSALLSIAASSSSADWTFELSFWSSLTQFDLIRLSSDSGLIRVGAHNSSLVLLLLNSSSSSVIGQTKWPISESLAAADWLTLSVSLTNGSATLTRTGSSGVRQSLTQLVDGLSHTFKRGSVSVRVGGDAASTSGGFRGCVRDLRLATSNLTFIAMETTVESSNATWGVCSRSVQCGSPSPCELSTSSRCLDVWNDFVCQCAADFGGRNCSVRLPSFSFGLGGNASSASFASVPAVSSVFGGDSWMIELRLVTLSPGAFLMLLGDPSDSATTPRLLVTIDSTGCLSAQILLSNGLLVATLTSSDSVATGNFVSVKIYLSISNRVLSLTVASAVKSASLNSLSPLSQPSGQLIVGGFNGAPSARWGRSKRSVSVLPASVASALPAGTTAFFGLLAALRINGDQPLISGPVSASSLSSLTGAIPATYSSGVTLATLENNACAVYEPCKNGATCSNVFLNSYSCQCHPGYSGTNCSTDYPDCHEKPCGSEEVCLEKSDPVNYNIKILPPPFNGAFSYGSAAGFTCVKSYGYRNSFTGSASQTNSFTTSAGFYVILVVVSAVLSAAISISVFFLLIRHGHLARNRSDDYTNRSLSGHQQQKRTDGGSDATVDATYTIADRNTVPTAENSCLTPSSPPVAAAELVEDVYDTTIDSNYANMDQKYKC